MSLSLVHTLHSIAFRAYRDQDHCAIFHINEAQLSSKAHLPDLRAVRISLHMRPAEWGSHDSLVLNFLCLAYRLTCICLLPTTTYPGIYQRSSSSIICTFLLEIFFITSDGSIRAGWT